MPRPRTPKLKAEITGRVMHDPQRFRNRNEPISKGPLGNAPKWMSHEQKTAWETFSDELPWLNHSHRALVRRIGNTPTFKDLAHGARRAARPGEADGPTDLSHQ